jgi:hypothetical protein
VNDFGVVSKNQKTVFKFKIINLESEAFVIWHVTVSCGCTSPQWTEKPVKENQKAVVKVKYDSTKIGAFNKSVFVYTNFDDRPMKLIIEGAVVGDEATSDISTESTELKGNLPINN